MVKIMNNNDLRKHQLIAFKALKDIDSIFKENGIKYFLLAGSLLGAIRHKDLSHGMTILILVFSRR